jgi:hypothetical protein
VRFHDKRFNIKIVARGVARGVAGAAEMEAKEKESQVAAWLKKIFGDHPIPQYEVNPRTTEILYHLSEHNKVRDRDVHLVIEDLKQKASEYESEGEIYV